MRALLGCSLLTAAVAAISLSSCDRAAPPPAASQAESIPREFSDRDWDTVFVAGGLANDTLLVRPRILAAADDRVVVFDYGDGRVKSFLPDGRLEWTYGRLGKGPGEFINAVDARVGRDGDVWIAGGGTRRITIVGKDGRLRKTFGFPGTHTIERLILLERDTVALPDLDTAAVSSWGTLPDSVLAAAPSLFHARGCRDRSGPASLGHRFRVCRSVPNLR